MIALSMRLRKRERSVGQRMPVKPYGRASRGEFSAHPEVQHGYFPARVAAGAQLGGLTRTEFAACQGIEGTLEGGKPRLGCWLPSFKFAYA